MLEDKQLDLAEWCKHLLDKLLESLDIMPQYVVLSLEESRFSVIIWYTKNITPTQETLKKVYLRSLPNELVTYLRTAHENNLQSLISYDFTWLTQAPLHGLWLPILQIEYSPTFIVIFSESSWTENHVQIIQNFWCEAQKYISASYYKIRKNTECLQEIQTLRKQLEALEASQQAMHENAIRFMKVHKQLTDSLQYAKKMQQAILPPERILRDNFEEYFITYLPKDIVSGDFYWFSQVDFTFIAVVDCTGHGVPGAFMSMIGSALLNEIVNAKRVNNPAQILSLLHIGVRNALNQDETQNLDGMDIGLCRLELTESFDLQLTFAGAKNNLYILQDGKINVLKGNRTHIGGISEANLTFDNQVITIQEGDIIYLLTDGLIDNPNEKRQKFGLNKFFDFILTNQHKPLSQQKTILENLVKEHQEKVEQRDDITVIALKP
ncbi:MAG: SpoIIE family protein phosphatase [Bacteroidia bacterium]|nr:SpoIIE family protein phosphatase [Bacteroidia bacterium]